MPCAILRFDLVMLSHRCAHSLMVRSLSIHNLQVVRIREPTYVLVVRLVVVLLSGVFNWGLELVL